MTEKDIDDLIAAAGLKDIMRVFGSVIEINRYDRPIGGDYVDAYGALDILINYVRANIPPDYGE